MMYNFKKGKRLNKSLVDYDGTRTNFGSVKKEEEVDDSFTSG